MNRNRVKYILLLSAGVVLVILGKVIGDRWSGVLIGLGAGLFGMSGGN